MPNYDFEDVSTGERLVISQEMSEVCDVDDVMEIDGRKLRHVWSPWSGGIAVSDNFENVTGYVMPKDHPSIDACGIKRDDMGHPVFTSRNQIKKFNKDSKIQNELDPSVTSYGWDGGKKE